VRFAESGKFTLVGSLGRGSIHSIANRPVRVFQNAKRRGGDLAQSGRPATSLGKVSGSSPVIVFFVFEIPNLGFWGHHDSAAKFSRFIEGPKQRA
jgi:hypothetical protein